MAMIRHAKICAKISLQICLVVAAALACSPITLHAQQAPTDRDIAIYAGLHAAAANGEVAEIEKLITDGENPNIQDANSRTPLLVAAFRKHYAAVEALLKRGANANARDMQGFDILTLAAVNNDLQLLKLALAGGADPRRVTGPLDGTALISAAHLGHVEIVRALIEANAPLASRIRSKYKTKNTTGYSLNAFVDFDRPVDIFRVVHAFAIAGAIRRLWAASKPIR